MPPDNRLLLLPLALAAGLLVWLAIRLLLRFRVTAKDKERRRRFRLSETGRLHSGWLTDVENGLIHYKYELHGVAYECSQDITSLDGVVPADSSRIAGPVTIKYFVRNPGNSIVVSEKWSGLRIRDAAPDIPIPKGESDNEEVA